MVGPYTYIYVLARFPQCSSQVAALRARNQELQQELETCRGEKLKLEEQILTNEAQLANALESLRQVSCGDLQCRSNMIKPSLSTVNDIQM